MREPHDQRRYRGQIERQLLIGAALIFLIVGGGLILFFYGRGAMFAGLSCMLGGAGIFLLLLLILKGLEKLGQDPEDDGADEISPFGEEKDDEE